MCELLGFSFNQPISPNISFKGFRRRGKSNPHGWGIAYYPDKSVQIIKEPMKSMDSRLAGYIEKENIVQSKIIISHVRMVSAGSISHKNTHPFSRELRGEDYVFAHNGTLRNYERNLILVKFQPIGETDSEHAFCYLMNQIAERNITNWTNEDCILLESELKKINQNGKFNCILSNGKFLFCYHDISGYNGLCYVKRESPFNEIQLVDKDYSIDLQSEKNPEQRGYIIATRALTSGEDWFNFEPGELKIFKDGKLIFPVVTHFNTILELKKEDVLILKIIRESEHKLKISMIIEETNLSKNMVINSIRKLKEKFFIKQDSRDNVQWNDLAASYYTIKRKRTEIDNLVLYS